MATRTHAREAVIELLYAYSCGNYDIKMHADSILFDKKIRNNQAIFATNLFDGVIAHLGDIDCVLESFVQWDFKKLGVVDKCILRLGVYEILHTATDLPVIIDEAIEISKILGGDDTVKFVNGVLDSIGKKSREDSNFVQNIVQQAQKKKILKAKKLSQHKSQKPKFKKFYKKESK